MINTNFNKINTEVADIFCGFGDFKQSFAPNILKNTVVEDKNFVNI